MALPPTKKRLRECESSEDLGERQNSPGKSSARPPKLSRDDTLHHFRAESQYIVVHRVVCGAGRNEYHERHSQTTDYFDVPRLLAGANRLTSLSGQYRLSNIDDYLEDNTSVSFAVCVFYSCPGYHDRIKKKFQRLSLPPMDDMLALQVRPYLFVLPTDEEYAVPQSEAIYISDGLRSALDGLNIYHPESLQDWDNAQNFTHPYLQLHYCKHLFTGASAASLDVSQQRHLQALSNYFDEHLNSEYTEAGDLFAKGLVNQKHWAKLFPPNEVVVTIEDGHPRAYVSTSCPTPNEHVLVLQCWSWDFDGKFFKNKKRLDVRWPANTEVISISDLAVYPLRFDQSGMEDNLGRRGRVLWTCRWRKFVSYDVPLQGMEVQIANLRYMVDMSTYKLMHTQDESPVREELPEATMRSEEPPTHPFLLLLPATVRGFGFHNKKWSMLLLDHIRDVTWNKEAFNHRLVLPEEKKELIRAVVTVHIGKDNAVKTDFMEGKGEKLIILLHGGPGTGKTLTAETVAEIAERPLYRVTCGDIGTDPESVEKYLESVLFIGTTWGCVVLLDEADVFLEERTKMDLQRNALVSVFLRVLEYYDGILILTSNRIGTFDEAFKSRVQLALHYPPLDQDGRWEVWRNFAQSLSDGGENINFDEINKKLPVLARHNLNGRQIRNTINTARQLARYKKDTLRYSHIDQAIKVVNEFEEYVLDVHGHDDEEYARAQGNR